MANPAHLIRTAYRKLRPPGIFFLCGHPRSGTNWMGAVLNLHPAIYCHGEFHLEALRHGVDYLQGQHWQITAKEPLRSELERAYEDLVRRCITAWCLPKRPEATWLGDRTPRELRPLIPGTPHFLAVRDGRDVLVSWTFHLLRLGPEIAAAVTPEPARSALLPLVHRFQEDPECFRREPGDLLRDETWVRHVARGWGQRIRHDSAMAERMNAGEVGAANGEPARVRTIVYEQLHADPEGQRAELYRFLGLDPRDAAPLSEENKTRPGFGREDVKSFFRKGEVGDWRTYFTPEARRWFVEEAGEQLVALGYEKNENW